MKKYFLFLVIFAVVLTFGFSIALAAVQFEKGPAPAPSSISAPAPAPAKAPASPPAPTKAPEKAPTTAPTPPPPSSSPALTPPPPPSKVQQVGQWITDAPKFLGNEISAPIRRIVGLPTATLSVQGEGGQWTSWPTITFQYRSRPTFRWDSTGTTYCNPIINTTRSDTRLGVSGSLQSEELTSPAYAFQVVCMTTGATDQPPGVYSNTININVQQQPAEPSGFTAAPNTVVQGQPVAFSWSPVSGATIYKLEYKLSSASQWTALVNVSASPATLTINWAPETYNVGILACNQDNRCSSRQQLTLTVNPLPQPQITRFGINGGNGDATVFAYQNFSLGWQTDAPSVDLTIACPSQETAYIDERQCNSTQHFNGGSAEIRTMNAINHLIDRRGTIQFALRANSGYPDVPYNYRIVNLHINPPQPQNHDFRFEVLGRETSQIIRGQEVTLIWYADFANSANITIRKPETGLELLNEAPLPLASQDGASFITREGRLRGRFAYNTNQTLGWPAGTYRVSVQFCNSVNGICRVTEKPIEVRDQGPPENATLNALRNTVILGQEFSLSWSARDAQTGRIQFDVNRNGTFDTGDYEENIADRSLTGRRWDGNASRGSVAYLRGVIDTRYVTTQPGDQRPYQVRYVACNSGGCRESGWVQIRVVSPEFTVPPAIIMRVDQEEPRFTRDDPIYSAAWGTVARIVRNLGSRIELRWNSKGADRCVGRGPWAGSPVWSGPERGQSGTFVIDSLNSSHLEQGFYIITCQGIGGETSRTIILRLPAPAAQAPTIPASQQPAPTPLASQTAAGVTFFADGNLDHANFTQGQYQNINLDSIFRAYIFNPTNPFLQTFSVNYGLRLFRRQGQNEIPLQFSEGRTFDYDGNSRGTRGFDLRTVVPVGNLEAGDYVLRATFNIFLATDPSGNFFRTPAERATTGIIISFDRVFTVNTAAVGQAQPPSPTPTPPPPPGEVSSFEITTERPSVILRINDEYRRVSINFGTLATLSWQLVGVNLESCRGVNWPATLPPSRNTGSAFLSAVQPGHTRYSLTCVAAADGRDISGEVELEILSAGTTIEEPTGSISAPLSVPPPVTAPSAQGPSAGTRAVSGPQLQGTDNCATTRSITLSWSYTAPPGRTQAAYDIQIADNSSFAREYILAEKGGGSDTSATVNYRFSTGTTYYWRLKIKEMLSDGTLTQWSGWSNRITFGEVGSRPQLVSPSNFTCGS